MPNDFVEAGYSRDIRRARLTKQARRNNLRVAFDDGLSADLRQRAQARLAGDMQPLVLRCARQLVRRGRVLNADFADLIQAGNIGLLQGLASWNPDGGAKLASWCAWSIKREMQRENDRLLDFASAETYDEVEDDSGNGHEYAASDEHDPEPAASLLEADAVLHDAGMTEQEIEAVRLLYWQDLSTREAATRMGISHTRVAELNRSALVKYRARLTVLRITGNYMRDR